MANKSVHKDGMNDANILNSKGSFESPLLLTLNEFKYVHLSAWS